MKLILRMSQILTEIEEAIKLDSSLFAQVVSLITKTCSENQLRVVAASVKNSLDVYYGEDTKRVEPNPSKNLRIRGVGNVTAHSQNSYQNISDRLHNEMLPIKSIRVYVPVGTDVEASVTFRSLIDAERAKKILERLTTAEPEKRRNYNISFGVPPPPKKKVANKQQNK